MKEKIDLNLFSSPKYGGENKYFQTASLYGHTMILCSEMARVTGDRILPCHTQFVRWTKCERANI